MRSKISFIATALALTPLTAFAAPRTFAEAVNLVLGYIQILVPIVFALTFVVLAWGIVQAWILGADNAEKVAEGKLLVVWGIMGLVVMSGIWGILAILRSSFFGF